MVGSSSPSSNKTHIPSSSPSSSVPTKPPKRKSIFTSYFFSKSLITILVLLVFFFFPSQVPEIFKETTIVTKLWELIYLLVIGIAVCYGLFSRKIDSSHGFDDSTDNIGGNETYFSGISHISSIFDDGNRDSYGFEEKSLFEECKGFEIGDGFAKSDGKKLNQYFLGESMVVINDENYVLEQLGRSKTTKQKKSLRLPVQNLGSKSLDSAAGKSVEDSSSGWDEIKNGKFRGLMPTKLEERFKDSDTDSDSDSQNPLNRRSKSMRLEKRGDMFASEANETSHGRPFSVGGLDFECLKSQSTRSQMPSKLKNLSVVEDSDTDSDSRNPLNRRFKSMRLEKRGDMFTSEANENSHVRPLSVGGLDFDGLKSQSMRSRMPSEIKNLSEKEELKGVEANHRYMKPYLNSETSFVESKPQEPNNVSFCEKDFIGKFDESSEEIMKDLGKNKVDDDGTFDSRNNTQFVKSKSQSSSTGASSERNLETFKSMLREEKADISNSIPKPAPVANGYKKGKSVRTNRSKEQVLESNVKTFQSQSDDKVETRSKLGINEMNVKADELSDTEPHSGEVDRKAEEFIAKFREQIRLQKVASARKLNLL